MHVIVRKKKRIFLGSFFRFLGICIALSSPCLAQSSSYTIDVSQAKQVITNKLKLGGKNKNGEQITTNNYFISKNGKPVIPVTAEFHFSRYPHQYWNESIRKIKAGGINTIATYVFWNIHEEKEGKFVWTGDRDLRAFVKLCAENGLNVIVRLGPFCHGEIRNGGLPDWLLAKPFTIRSNDPGYLSLAEKLYQQIGAQLNGLYFKDGGPIIGVQIENEFQHSAAPWALTYPGQPHDFTTSDRDRAATHEGVAVAEANNPFAELGNDHMRVLKSLAVKAGMIVPIYTATGWGNAAIIPNESIPVTAAYAYPTWTDKIEPSPFYLFTNMHETPDYSPVRYTATDYPAFAAELGAGMAVNYTRRPTVPANSLDALINRCLGSGANGVGYYMFHGGSNPVGERYFFSDEAYAYPKINYDYQAPIGEYGQVRPSFHRLKLLHFFLNDFAGQLAPMVTVLPAGNAAIKPGNIADLRYAARAINGSGFLFVNNFQDNIPNKDRTGISITVKTGSDDIRIPAKGGFNLTKEENAIFPFNLNMHGANLQYATAQLMLKNEEGNKPYYVFFVPPGVTPEFCFAKKKKLKASNISGSLISSNEKFITVTCPKEGRSSFSINVDGRQFDVLVIDKLTALKAYDVKINNSSYVVFSDAVVLPSSEGLEFQHIGQAGFNVSFYPKLKAAPASSFAALKVGANDVLFSNYKLIVPEFKSKVQYTELGNRKLRVELPAQLSRGLNDVFLNIDYIGDTGMGFIKDELIADDFYRGSVWDIGLKRFIDRKNAKEMIFYFRPAYKNASFTVDLKPESARIISANQQTFMIKNISFVPEFSTLLQFSR